MLIGVPDLIGEVISTSSFMSDTDTKFNVYQNQGVNESAEQRLITVYELINGRYELVEMGGTRGVIHSKVLPNLEINLEDVFDV